MLVQGKLRSVKKTITTISCEFCAKYRITYDIFALLSNFKVNIKLKLCFNMDIYHISNLTIL